MENPIWLIIFGTVAALMPLIIGLLTSYLKVSIVLNVLKNALGTQQVPSSLVVMALSMALTFHIMSPQLNTSFAELNKIKFPKKIENIDVEKFKVVALPWIEFLKKHAGERELKVLKQGSKKKKINSEEEVEKEITDLKTIVPAFVLTELKEAFSMAFVVLLPFMVIDLIVANILVGLGMHMLSPVMISLPLKILLFVVSDAWLLLTKGLVESYSLSFG